MIIHILAGLASTAFLIVSYLVYTGRFVLKTYEQEIRQAEARITEHLKKDVKRDPASQVALLAYILAVNRLREQLRTPAIDCDEVAQAFIEADRLWDLFDKRYTLFLEGRARSVPIQPTVIVLPDRGRAAEKRRKKQSSGH